MKKFICIWAILGFFSYILTFSAVAIDNVIINQVYVDAIDTEAGGEAIELYNPTFQEIDISGYTIRTESSNSDVTLPDNSIINASGYYLIADNGWAILKDNMSWPNADHEEAVTMYNTNSGIALVNINDEILDAVGWGKITEIEPGLYESIPVINPNTGFVLLRNNFQDTGNNSNDFVISQPNFHNSSSIFEADDDGPINDSGNEGDGEDENDGNTTSDYIELPIIINLTNSLPSILSYNLTIDDSEDLGYQLIPLPGQQKQIPINVLVGDNDGGDDIDNVELLITSSDFVQEVILEKVVNNTISSLFSGNISMKYYDDPGNYNILITATDQNNENIELNFGYEYLSLIAFDLDTEILVFNAKNKETAEIIGDDDFNSLSNPTIKNLGNTELNLGVYSGNLAINDNLLQYKFAQDYYNVSSDVQVSEEMLGHGMNETLSLGFKLILEKYLKPDAYLSSLNIIGVVS